MKPNRLGYKSTISAGFIGYITQAITINFAPLLFITFQKEYSLSLSQISFFITVTFCVQLLMDALAAKFSDRFNPRRASVLAHFFAAIGTAGLGLFPMIMPPYLGLIIATIIAGAGSGLVEVMVTPIIESCPTPKKQKGSYISLLHSFYCWGYALVTLLSTLFFNTLGIEKWAILACLWAIIPLVGGIMFCFVPIYPMKGNSPEGSDVKESHLYLRSRTFWAIFVMMLCAGASEMTMSQWASGFAEAALHVDKQMGDLLGPCMFAILMGSARVINAKIGARVKTRHVIGVSAILCIVSYLVAALSGNPIVSLISCAICGLSVGVMWPCNISAAAAALPKCGVSMFAFLALSGDIGCLTGPVIAGNIAELSGGNMRVSFLVSAIYPLALLIALAYFEHFKKKDRASKD